MLLDAEPSKSLLSDVHSAAANVHSMRKAGGVLASPAHKRTLSERVGGTVVTVVDLS